MVPDTVLLHSQTPFSPPHRRSSLMRSRNVSRVSSDMGTQTASLRWSDEVLTSIVKNSGNAISFPRTTIVPRIFPSFIINRSVRLSRVGFLDRGGSQFNWAKDSCCWKSREPQISIVRSHLAQRQSSHGALWMTQKDNSIKAKLWTGVHSHDKTLSSYSHKTDRRADEAVRKGECPGFLDGASA